MKWKIILLAGQLLVGALDARSTRKAINHGGMEYNPVVRPFAHSPVIYAEFPAVSVGGFLLARKIEKKHTRLKWLGWTVQGQDLVGHTSGWLVTRQAGKH